MIEDGIVGQVLIIEISRQFPVYRRLAFPIRLIPSRVSRSIRVTFERVEQ